MAASKKKPAIAFYEVVFQGKPKVVRAFLSGLVGTASPWLLPVVVGNGILYAHAARSEERKFADSSLAAAYADYRSRTGMFFPNPLKMLKNKR